MGTNIESLAGLAEHFFGCLQDVPGVELARVSVKPARIGLVDRLERLSGAALPEDYRAFLLRGFQGASVFVDDGGGKVASGGRDFFRVDVALRELPRFRKLADSVDDPQTRRAILTGVPISQSEPHLVLSDTGVFLMRKQGLLDPAPIASCFTGFFESWLAAGCFSAHDFALYWSKVKESVPLGKPLHENAWLQYFDRLHNTSFATHGDAAVSFGEVTHALSLPEATPTASAVVQAVEQGMRAVALPHSRASGGGHNEVVSAKAEPSIAEGPGETKKRTKVKKTAKRRSKAASGESVTRSKKVSTRSSKAAGESIARSKKVPTRSSKKASTRSKKVSSKAAAGDAVQVKKPGAGEASARSKKVSSRATAGESSARPKKGSSKNASSKAAAGQTVTRSSKKASSKKASVRATARKAAAGETATRSSKKTSSTSAAGGETVTRVAKTRVTKKAAKTSAKTTKKKTAKKTRKD